MFVRGANYNSVVRRQIRDRNYFKTSKIKQQNTAVDNTHLSNYTFDQK